MRNLVLPSSWTLSGAALEVLWCVFTLLLHRLEMTQNVHNNIGKRSISVSPCSLDLAPCDLWLVLKMKATMKPRGLESIRSNGAAMTASAVKDPGERGLAELLWKDGSDGISVITVRGGSGGFMVTCVFCNNLKHQYSLGLAMVTGLDSHHLCGIYVGFSSSPKTHSSREVGPDKENALCLNSTQTAQSRGLVGFSLSTAAFDILLPWILASMYMNFCNNYNL